MTRKRTLHRLPSLVVSDFYDSWFSVMGGRKRMLTSADMVHEHPRGHALLTNLCQLVAFLEGISDLVNDAKPRPLHELFRMMKDHHSRLLAWAEMINIGTTADTRALPSAAVMARLTLSNGEAMSSPSPIMQRLTPLSILPGPSVRFSSLCCCPLCAVEDCR